MELDSSDVPFNEIECSEKETQSVWSAFKFITYGEFAKEWKSHFLQGKTSEQTLEILKDLCDSPYIQFFIEDEDDLYIPTLEMAKTFVNYISQAHSWYKHINISGEQWWVGLNPLEAFRRHHTKEESKITLEAVTNKDRFHYNFRTTHCRQNQYGGLDYRRGCQTSEIQVVIIPKPADRERFAFFWRHHLEVNSVGEDDSRDKFIMDTFSVEKPDLVQHIGSAEVNCMVWGTDHLLRLEGEKQFEDFIFNKTGVNLTEDERYRILEIAAESGFRRLSSRKNKELVDRFVKEERQFQIDRLLRAVRMLRELLYGLSRGAKFDKFYRTKYANGSFVDVHAEHLLSKWFRDFLGIHENGWIHENGVEPM